MLLGVAVERLLGRGGRDLQLLQMNLAEPTLAIWSRLGLSTRG